MASRSLVSSTKMFKHIEISRCFKYSLLISDNFYNNNIIQLRRWSKCNRRFCTSTNLNEKDKDKIRKDKNNKETSSTSSLQQISSHSHENKSKFIENVISKDLTVEQPFDKDKSQKEVSITYYRGLPQITIPLPSRKERCRFTLRPISNTVGDFREMIKNEDKGIDRVTIQSKEGIRIAASNTIESLLEDDFFILINDNLYFVNTPAQERLTQEEIRRLSDVKNLVHQLYEALNVEEHQIQKERELHKTLEQLKCEIEPMELKRQELEVVAQRRTNVLTWLGLGLMSVQFGILARLTWWEYSWDIMEPVTYFVTYGTAMAGYAYFVLTKQEYILPEVKDRQHLLTLHKKAKKLGLDLNQYNSLKDRIRWIEKDLRRLRDPLTMKLPPTYTVQFQDSFKKETTMDKLKKFVTLKSK
ncbi:calcium uniporter protein, mitochondrial [Chrysoperla carnea]|uniref:calcium uniporter protein, mitochondrial n=1 Tax=Chrysoperla carnea TaxID=189513 RepID=UPI001D07D737|nr:calcium uniporter protein, mitochondrial [Chrysoperla carnea]